MSRLSVGLINMHTVTIVREVIVSEIFIHVCLLPQITPENLCAAFLALVLTFAIARSGSRLSLIHIGCHQCIQIFQM